MLVAIIDYGSGNLRSATKAFERVSRESNLEAEIVLTGDAGIVRRADRIVLPGVGAYADCRAGLDAVPDMVDTLNDKVRHGSTPFLGICVGMQLMADRGLEKTTAQGLGWIGGDVVEMKPSDTALKIPQIGWNTLNVQKDHPLLENIDLGENGLHAYFVHSYHFEASETDCVIATADYGIPITAMVAKNNMAGTQFHPEKARPWALR